MRAAVLALLAAIASPASAATWQLDVGYARVTTDAFVARAASIEGARGVPGFRRDLPIVALGRGFGAGLATLGVAAFASDADRFSHTYPARPPFDVPRTIDHQVRVAGARAAWTPHLPLGGGWEIDGALGVLYLHRRIDTGQLAAGTETQDDFAPYAGIGISRWFTRSFGLRAGADLADDYQSLTLGVRLAF